MKRKIITIDREKCIGCAACASACHEGAIGMVDGKAQVLREDYCDGLGNCLPVCPAGALKVEEREAPTYDAQAVKEAKLKNRSGAKPGHKLLVLEHSADDVSELRQWPCKLRLVAPTAPYYDGQKIALLADCTAYAYAKEHSDFMKGNVTLTACPKLDGVDYGAKLAEILSTNDVKGIVAVRMEVPCCGGIELVVKKALAESGKTLPVEVVTISLNGNIINKTAL